MTRAESEDLEELVAQIPEVSAISGARELQATGINYTI